MIVDTDNLAPVELPVYIDKTAEVLNWMKSKSKEELKAVWKCNDKIAEQNFHTLETMDLYRCLLYTSPSIMRIIMMIFLRREVFTGGIFRIRSALMKIFV